MTAPQSGDPGNLDGANAALQPGDPNTLYAYADAINKAETALRQAAEEFRVQLSRLRSVWEGSAAEAFDTHGKKLNAAADEVSATVRNPGYATLISQAADALAAAKRELGQVSGARDSGRQTLAADPAKQTELQQQESAQDGQATQVLQRLSQQYYLVGGQLRELRGDTPANGGSGAGLSDGAGSAHSGQTGYTPMMASGGASGDAQQSAAAAGGTAAGALGASGIGGTGAGAPGSGGGFGRFGGGTRAAAHGAAGAGFGGGFRGGAGGGFAGGGFAGGAGAGLGAQSTSDRWSGDGAGGSANAPGVLLPSWLGGGAGLGSAGGGGQAGQRTGWSGSSGGSGSDWQVGIPGLSGLGWSGLDGYGRSGPAAGSGLGAVSGPDRGGRSKSTLDGAERPETVVLPAVGAVPFGTTATAGAIAQAGAPAGGMPSTGGLSAPGATTVPAAPTPPGTGAAPGGSSPSAMPPFGARGQGKDAGERDRNTYELEDEDMWRAGGGNTGVLGR